MLFAAQIFVNTKRNEEYEYEDGEENTDPFDLRFKILFIFCKQLKYKDKSNTERQGYPFALVDFTLSELNERQSANSNDG